ncbi:MAG: arsenate reductase family protein [Myxococcales bacterium]|nr:arsenate reductase family protein [Myxococcales bacterium]
MPLAVHLFHYPKCSTCRRAIAFVRATVPDVRLTLTDLVVTPPSRPQVEALVARSGLPLRRWFNTSGESYRNGQFGARIPSMSDAEQLDALAADGKLIKRPVVIIRAGEGGALEAGTTVLVGFDEATWAEALQAAR